METFKIYGFVTGIGGGTKIVYYESLDDILTLKEKLKNENGILSYYNDIVEINVIKKSE